MGALTVAAASLAGVLLIALWMVSVVGWVRTAPLRRGRLPPQVEPANRVPPGPRRTSRATYLPGAIGSLLFVAGVAGAIQGLGAGAIGLAVVASAIAGAGFSARVSQIEAGPDGLMVA